MKRKSSTTISAKRQTASDTERFSLYKPALDEFMTPFFAENRSATPPNPQEVADAVARVIAQPAGERPLRTVVATAAQHQAPQEVNGAATHATQSYLQMLGILPLVTLVPKTHKHLEKDEVPRSCNAYGCSASQAKSSG